MYGAFMKYLLMSSPSHIVRTIHAYTLDRALDVTFPCAHEVDRVNDCLVLFSTPHYPRVAIVLSSQRDLLRDSDFDLAEHAS